MATLELVRGDDEGLTFTVTRGDDPVDLRLSGTTLAFTAVPRVGDAITKSTENDGEIDIDSGGDGNIGTVNILGADTAELERIMRYDYDIQLTEPDGKVTTVANSTFTVVPDVTQ